MSQKVKPVRSPVYRDNMFLTGCVLMLMACLGLYCTALAFALSDTTGQFIASGVTLVGFTGSVVMIAIGLRKK